MSPRKQVLLLTTFFALCASAKCASLNLGCSETADETSRFPFNGETTQYWECINGAATLRYCPEDHHYDQVSQTCKTIADLPSTMSIECDPDSVDFLPHPSDCSKYIWCYYGTPYVIDCDDGLWFSPSEIKCVDPVSAGCTTTSQPPWTTPGSVCDDVPDGEIVLKKCTCGCLYYWECRGKQQTLKECEFKLYFVEERQLCAGLIDCRDQTRTPFPWTTTFPTTIVSRPDYNDPRCDGLNDVYLPHPDCTKFTHCEIGWGRVWNCPSGLYFNAIELRCGPYSDSSCGNFTTLSVPPPTTTNTPPFTGDPRCNPDGTLDLLPYPSDCSKFLECYEGNSYLLSCPEGLWFSPDKKICVEPSQTNCIASTTESASSNYVIECTEGSLLPHHNDCRKFVECYESGTFERTCPSGLHFDGKNGRCISPQVSDCAI